MPTPTTRRAFTLLEVLVSVVLFTITATSVYYAMLAFNRQAAATRALNSAKTICQHYVDAAFTAHYHPRYSSPDGDGKRTLLNPTEITPILQDTTGGTVTAPKEFPPSFTWQNDTVAFDPKPGTPEIDPVDVQTDPDSNTPLIRGYIYRSVVPIGPDGLLSVRFSISFLYRGRVLTSELNTIKAPDSI